MSIKSIFGTDPKVERDGAWLDFGEFRVRVARAGGANKSYQRALEEESREHRRVIELNALDPELAEDILRRVYARAVVRDWETKRDGEMVQGIELEDGAELLPVNPENVLAAFRAFPDLFSTIQADAASIAMFRAGLRESAAGN